MTKAQQKFFHKYNKKVIYPSDLDGLTLWHNSQHFITRDKIGRYASLEPKEINWSQVVACSLIALIAGLAIAGYIHKPCDTKLISPLAEQVQPTATPTPKPIESNTIITGEASWYGTGDNECLGCNKNRIMANGEVLDDNKQTIACGLSSSCHLLPLGSKVKIINQANGMTTTATVTDKGGLRPGRIIDVTKAVLNRVNADGNFQAKVILLEAN